MKKSNNYSLPVTLCLGLLVLLFAIPLINAQDSSETVFEANNSISKEVYVGIYVLNLGKFDVSTGSFTVDFYLSIKCNETCPEQNFEFMNGRATSIDKTIDEPNEKFYRIQATLASPVDLRKFPFDSQKMQLILEDKQATVDDFVYVADDSQSGIDDSIAFVGWNLDGWNSEVREHSYDLYDETYSQYVYSIDISRLAFNSFLKTFLPIFFILMVVLLSLFMDPDKITTRITMNGTNLVAAVMFHISITNQIPPVGYLTFADKIMMLTYFVLVVSFAINIAIVELLEAKNEKLLKKVHSATEWNMAIFVPILYILMFLFFI